MGIIYSLQTGAITASFACPRGYEHNQCDEGEWWKSDDIDPQLNYVDIGDFNHPVLPRVAVLYSLDKSIITADGLDIATIGGLPTAGPAELVVEDPDGVREVVVGDIEFVADVPGDYILRLSSGIHLTTEITITATAVI